VVTAVIVEDDVLTRVTLSELLEAEGFSVRAFGDTDEALRACAASPPAVLITDLCVPGSLTTRDLVRYVRDASAETKIIFITGYTSEDIDEGSSDLVDVERYAKPLDFDALISSLRRPVERIQDSGVQGNCAI
jgi:two-component system C4-dicarboxylate transport response regulator DctD